MTESIDIPADDVPAHVLWYDRLGAELSPDKTATTWTAEDAAGGVSTVVSITPGQTDEQATVVFLASTGQFKLVAMTEGVRAESPLYNVVPGAPASGVIALGGPA
ncbi:MAG TPA: hypothetical protein VFB50_23580 [Chloroflexota bacterium]|nr:hypothetical protein [Chloroflexota bacterium]